MNIYGQTLPQLKDYMVKLGEKPSKAVFLFKGLYKEKIQNFQDTPVLKEQLKELLAQDFQMELPTLVEQTAGEDTAKFLFSLKDGSLIEAVLMKQKYGNSLCISSQVGCNMACAFCQSGRFKRVRNLTAAEMVTQVLAVENLIGEKVNNIVLMGIGEPLDNYEEVTAFIDIVSHQQGLAIGMRHITLSTCGIVPRIYDYMEREAPGPLAISLHAPNNELRNQLMPINRRYPVEELMTSVKAYIKKTNKKVMLEYVMLDGINDKPEHAYQLADLIGDSDCHVNLIPYNATQNLGFAPSTMENIKIFYDILRDKGIFVNLRREFGASVQAACGQLKANYLEKTNM